MPCSAICACSVSTFPVMKHIYYLSFFLLLVSACDKDKFHPDYSNGKAEAFKNGENWMGQGYALISQQDKYAFLFSVYNQYGELRQELYFHNIPREIGTYPLYKVQSQNLDSISSARFFTLSSDGDVIEDHYYVKADSLASSIFIESIDTNSGWVNGKFNAVFYIDPDRPKFNPANPDTIRFTNGTFSAKLLE
jgi:hypothetical protein